MKRYEISFESEKESGSVLIYARTDAEARKKFRSRYHGRIPTFWISAMWSLS